MSRNPMGSENPLPQPHLSRENGSSSARDTSHQSKPGRCACGSDDASICETCAKVIELCQCGACGLYGSREALIRHYTHTVRLQSERLERETGKQSRLEGNPSLATMGTDGHTTSLPPEPCRGALAYGHEEGTYLADAASSSGTSDPSPLLVGKNSEVEPLIITSTPATTIVAASQTDAESVLTDNLTFDPNLPDTSVVHSTALVCPIEGCGFVGDLLDPHVAENHYTQRHLRVCELRNALAHNVTDKARYWPRIRNALLARIEKDRWEEVLGYDLICGTWDFPYMEVRRRVELDSAPAEGSEFSFDNLPTELWLLVMVCCV